MARFRERARDVVARFGADAPEIRADNCALAAPAAVNADSATYSAANGTLAVGGAANEKLSVWWLQPAIGPSDGSRPYVLNARNFENRRWAGPWKSDEPVLSSPSSAQRSASSSACSRVWVA